MRGQVKGDTHSICTAIPQIRHTSRHRSCSTTSVEGIDRSAKSSSHSIDSPIDMQFKCVRSVSIEREREVELVSLNLFTSILNTWGFYHFYFLNEWWLLGLPSPFPPRFANSSNQDNASFHNYLFERKADPLYFTLNLVTRCHCQFKNYTPDALDLQGTNKCFAVSKVLASQDKSDVRVIFGSTKGSKMHGT